jgi:voltage-gated potassium channel Kch
VPIVVAVVAVGLILLALRDVFETVVLPRRVNRRFRIARLVIRGTWRPTAQLARLLHDPAQRESFLAHFGPLVVLLLLVTWAVVFIIGYAALQWAFGSQLTAPEGAASFGTDLYMSATTFFTLGFGDVVPRSAAARVLAVIEVANGFGLIALVIGYMPALYQSFSRREVNISLLDARAGSPPTAGEFLRRHLTRASGESLDGYLKDWERWAAELMETHLSYPALAYFRSQHDNQSWVAAITVILDVCALVLAGVKEKTPHQTKLTFAIARHAVVDLSQVFFAEPRPLAADRLSPAGWQRLMRGLEEVGISPKAPDRVEARLRELRAMYEPYVNGLAEYLEFPLPGWLPAVSALDDWQTSAAAHDPFHHALPAANGLIVPLGPVSPEPVEVAAETVEGSVG